MSPTKKTHGKGATISCLIKFIHHSQLIKNKYLDPASEADQQEGSACNCHEIAIVIHNDNFKESDGETLQELYAVKTRFTIQAEGDPGFFFDVPVVVDSQE